ncbi:hypothetical protein Droror1_Dr00007665 [Drosera rotundifolia]
MFHIYTGDCILHSIIGCLDGRYEKETGKPHRISMKYFKQALLRAGLINRSLLGEDMEGEDDEVDEEAEPEMDLVIVKILEWVRNNPLVSEDEYTTYDNVTEEMKRYKLSGYNPAKKNTNNKAFFTSLYAELEDKGPIIGVIPICKDFRHDEKGGYEAKRKQDEIVDQKEFRAYQLDPSLPIPKPKPVFHAVVLTGIGRENGVDYCEYLNSHGPDFGVKAYEKICCSKLHSITYVWV